jgi:hypothetical protein
LHLTLGAPSPGVKTKLVGLAVVVTEITPTGVSMYAFTLNGCQIAGGTQNHVPTLVTMEPAAGAE